MPKKTPPKTAPKAPSKARRATRSAKPARSARPAVPPITPRARPGTKQARLLGLLRSDKGVSIPEAAKALHWQLHSVRGVLSGVIKKRLGLRLEKITDAKSATRYRVAP